MKDKIKENIMKSVVILSIVCFGIPFLVGLVEIFLPKTECVINILYYIGMGSFISFLFFGVLTMILLPFFGKYLDKKSKSAEKRELKLSSYDELVNYFSNKGDTYSYKKIFSHDELLIYEKKEIGCSNLVVFNKNKEFDNLLLDKLEIDIDNFMKDYFGKTLNSITINIIFIVCTDISNNDFQKFVDSFIYQSYRIFKIRVGMAFDKKMMYLSDYGNEYAIFQYKKLVKRFYKMFNEIIGNKL